MPGAPYSSSPPHVRNPGAPFSSPPPAPPQLENCDPYAGYQGFCGAAAVDGTTQQTADTHSAAYVNNNVVRVAPDEAAAQLPLQASGALAHLSLVKAQILMLNIVYKNEGSKQVIPRAIAYMIWHQLKSSKPSFVTLLSGMQLRQMRQPMANQPWQLIYGPWPSAWRLSPGALPASSLRRAMLTATCSMPILAGTPLPRDQTWGLPGGQPGARRRCQMSTPAAFLQPKAVQVNSKL